MNGPVRGVRQLKRAVPVEFEHLALRINSCLVKAASKTKLPNRPSTGSSRLKSSSSPEPQRYRLSRHFSKCFARKR
ncbi:hypothetical protein ACVIN2_002411 [Bradyrhizobium sp. USDA 3650]